ncbi:AI-2E family transporter [Candidatus Gottesmanbacteria bacterium]|nr:AI-2E family transporter [Candidatus Gottesmanbacteria bacterium]
MPTKVEVSYKTIVFIVAFLLLLWFLYQVREIISWIFVSFILMSALKPWAESLEKFRVPRALSVMIMYILIIGILALAVTTLLPPFVVQSAHLIERLPGFLNQVIPFIKVDQQIMTQQITSIGENAIRVTVGLFNNILAVFTIFVIAFYLTIERGRLKNHLDQFMGEESADPFVKVLSKIEERLGAWVRGQFILAVTIGVVTYIALFALKIPYALPLALLAGLLEIVPIIGPIIAAIPGILVAFTISPFHALITTGAYILIQQLEANLVVPFVMKKAVGLPPLVTIIALMAGAKISGIGGALLSIPILVTVETAFSQYLKSRTHPQK